MKLPRPHGRGIFSLRFVGSGIPPKRKTLRYNPRAHAPGVSRRGIKWQMENHKIENSLGFNSEPSKIMHIDFNSCFATIEQQANPFLRGKPIVVAAFTTNKGCILAASVEAKKLGIKTGMKVMDGKAIYPKLTVFPSDTWKYRNVHLKL